MAEFVQLTHTAQQVDDAVDAVATKADKTALDAEITAREAADTALGKRIDAKAEQSALTAETAAREAADTALEEKVDAIPDPLGAYVVETASGSVTQLDDGADGVPLKSCIVSIDYASGGWTGCSLIRAGVNLVDTSPTIGKVIGEDITTPLLFTLSGGFTLPLGVPLTAFIRFTDGTGLVSDFVVTTNAGQNINPNQYTTLERQPSILRFYTNARGLSLAAGKTITALGIATAIGDYGPYQPVTAYPISWEAEAGTVYGGELDLTEGVLTSTLDAEGNSLATPQVYQLEPLEITTLLGANNIWADTGDVSVEYRADPTILYNKLTNAIISTGGNV